MHPGHHVAREVRDYHRAIGSPAESLSRRERAFGREGRESPGGERILDRVVRALQAATEAPPLLIANDPDAASWRPDLKAIAKAEALKAEKAKKAAERGEPSAEEKTEEKE